MSQSRRAAVIRAGALGDFLLGLPALRAMRGALGDAQIALVGPLPVSDLALQARCIDTLYGVDDPRFAPLFVSDATEAALAGVPGDLHDLDLVVVWLRDPEGAVAAALRRLGARRVLTAPPFPPPGGEEHVADHLVKTLAPLGVSLDTLPAEARAPRVVPVPEARTWAAGWLERAGLSPGSRLIAVHPGSGSPRKNWPPERIAAALARTRAARALTPVLALGLADEAPGAAVLRALSALGGPVPVVARDLDLFQLAALLERCAAYLGNDSGVTHLAAATGAPVVAVFGPTDPRQWAPRGPDPARIRVVAPETFAGPDATYGGNLWPDVDEVVAALDDVLGS